MNDDAPKKPSGGGFYQIPNDFRRTAAKIKSVAAFRVLFYLLGCTRRHKMTAHPKQITMAKELELNVGSISRAIQELVDLGIVTIEHKGIKGQRSTLYGVHLGASEICAGAKNGRPKTAQAQPKNCARANGDTAPAQKMGCADRMQKHTNSSKRSEQHQHQARAAADGGSAALNEIQKDALQALYDAGIDDPKASELIRTIPSLTADAVREIRRKINGQHGPGLIVKKIIANGERIAGELEAKRLKRIEADAQRLASAEARQQRDAQAKAMKARYDDLAKRRHAAVVEWSCNLKEDAIDARAAELCPNLRDGARKACYPPGAIRGFNESMPDVQKFVLAWWAEARPDVAAEFAREVDAYNADVKAMQSPPAPTPARGDGDEVYPTLEEVNRAMANGQAAEVR